MINKLASKNENDLFDNDSDKTSDAYNPGVCNLGKKETSDRKLKAYSGLILTIFCIAVIEWMNLSNKYRLLIFFPLAYSIICFIQAKEKFCVVFGLRGVYNFNDKRKLTKISSKEFISKDRRKSLWILFQSVIFAIIITILYYYLPA
jgi:hypothetical protein